MRGLTPSDLSIRLHRAHGGARAALKTQYAAAVEAWSDADAARLDALVARNRAQLDALAPWLPDTVLFIHASDAIDGGLPHTRANAIVMGPVLPGTDAGLDGLFLHELFHVLSRHATPAVRAELYGLIGFERCTRLHLPRGLRMHGISNPDVEDAAFTVAVDAPDGRTRALMPFLSANPPRYAAGKPAFEDYFELVFLDMTRSATGACTLRRGADAQLSPGEVRDALYAHTGRNTGYIFHAEETLADNFSYLMLGRTDLPDMWVLDRLRARLAAGPAARVPS